MKRIIFLLVAIFLIKLYFDTDKTEEIYEVVCERSDGRTETIDLEQYIMGVVAGEMPISFEEEALKAQSVAARTFVLSRNLHVDDSISSQVYLDEEQRKERWKDQFEEYEKKLRNVVKDTKGEVLMYNDHYISALFFSSSSGKTENNEDYFQSNALPYLRSVSSSYETPIIEYKNVTSSQLLELFSGSEVRILNYTEGGNVNEVRIGNSIYSGREVREKLSLNSSCFEVSKTENGYSFTTYGYGHQVGMSQYGANGMAKEGYKYKEILQHYYQGACINSLK